jgi:hypothetical protein
MTRIGTLALAALTPAAFALSACVDTEDAVVERRVITSSTRPTVIRDRRPNAIIYQDNRPRSITYEDNRPDSITYEDNRPEQIIYPSDD